MFQKRRNICSKESAELENLILHARRSRSSVKGRPTPELHGRTSEYLGRTKSVDLSSQVLTTHRRSIALCDRIIPNIEVWRINL
jgi:hypothetical protein